MPADQFWNGHLPFLAILDVLNGQIKTKATTLGRGYEKALESLMCSIQ